MNVVYGPGWWCKRCRQWWPGSWPLSFVRPEHDRSDDEVRADNVYAYRTCAECGDVLEMRARPLRFVQLRQEGG